ncbi:MAG: 4-hydroxybenzoate octaprenyltransferase [Halieaceae bacterium]|jgi:4-hydroxybenzoate polyprenyltransferase|nr:4-hydroxybenzoate octaprenyltransferase [Halieaceae bacterium]
MPISSKIAAFLSLIRFNKPIGTLLLLWPTMGALWIAAKGVPDYSLLAIFIAGTFLMRSAGCIVNDMADRNLDGAVARTVDRPLVTGAISLGEAVIFAALLCLLAFGLVLLTNTLTVFLSLVAVLLTSVYPFMKRHTNLPQIVLGAAFSWGIPMAFAAQMGYLPAEMWLLYFGNLLWTIVYDTEYAMVDRADDLKVGIRSTAILFGDADRMIIGCLQGMCLLAFFLAGQRFGLGTSYTLALVVVIALFGYQQYLIRQRQPAACFKAFKHNNWVGIAVFIGIVLNYPLTPGS